MDYRQIHKTLLACNRCPMSADQEVLALLKVPTFAALLEDKCQDYIYLELCNIIMHWKHFSPPTHTFCLCNFHYYIVDMAADIIV